MDPFPTVVTQPMERTRHAMDQRWGTCHDNDCNDDVDEGDETDENEDDADEDEDEDEDQPGLFAWDLLGEHFDCEAAALGVSSSCKPLTRLMVL